MSDLDLSIPTQIDELSVNDAPDNADSSNPSSALMTLSNVSFVINTDAQRNTQTQGQKISVTEWLLNSRPKATTSDKSSHGERSNNPSSTGKTLLTNINISILPDEKISVIGPNGAGKSTLMKLILGLLTPTSGTIDRHQALNIGYVPQKFAVPAILPLRVCDLLAQVQNHLTPSQQALLYERLSIQPLLKQQVIHLSGGETQRVLIARALLSKPNLLILDEPMQGLDPESERWLYEFIDDLPTFLRCAMVVVSHDLHWVMQGSRHVICLNKHICCEGQPSEIGILDEFKKIFGHQYEQPYIHKPHCQHQGL